MHCFDAPRGLRRRRKVRYPLATHSGTLYQWLLNGTTVIGAGSPAGPPPTGRRGRGGLQRRWQGRLLWRHTSGTLYTYLMNGTTVIGAGSPGGLHRLDSRGRGDFNGDGKADILFRHTSGTLFIYFLNGTTVIGTGSPGGASTDWTVVGVGTSTAMASRHPLPAHFRNPLHLLPERDDCHRHGVPGRASTAGQSWAWGTSTAMARPTSSSGTLQEPSSSTS